MLNSLPHREVWAVDFEFHQDGNPGGTQVPVCMVAKELRSGQVLRLWQDDLRALRKPPFDIGPQSVYVAYLASAELHCHLSLGWPLPANVIDCYAEFRTLTNGLPLPRGRGLLGALTWFGIDAISTEEKTSWRDLILAGGPWTDTEKQGILDYCQSDVDALGHLLPRLVTAMESRPHWLPHALLRGWYMRALAAIEHRGVPVDTEMLGTITEQWDNLKIALINRICADFPVFEGTTFKLDRFESLLASRGVPWPRTETGRLALDENTFREQVRSHPWLAPIREARDGLAKLRLADLSVGPDGRNRALFSPFGTKTSRNAPSNTKSIFGPSVWIRGLIKPSPGKALAYVDFSAQEVAIAAKLSGDTALQEGYERGDPYLDFAIRAALVPPDATRDTHGDVRDQCKTVVLGTQYGMRTKTLANRMGVIPFKAEQLLRAHQETYPSYWQWVNGVVNYASLHGYLDTTFGWRLAVTSDVKPTTLQNFPCQANGAEMLRIACAMAHDAGLPICAPVHDAILMESPLETLFQDVRQLREIMTEAGKIVLDGFTVRTDATIFRYPRRYMDKRGTHMWRLVSELLEREECALG